LSPNTFSSFVDRQAKYNTSEAIKSYTIERYTADSLVKFLKHRLLENNVDLVEGGHLTLLRTKDEERAAKADFEAASAAGLNLTAIRWIPNQMLIEVGFTPQPVAFFISIFLNTFSLEIWIKLRFQLHGSLVAGTQPLAMQTSHRTL